MKGATVTGSITENTYLQAPVTVLILHVGSMCVGRGGGDPRNFEGHILK